MYVKGRRHLLVLLSRHLLEEVWNALTLGDVKAQAAEEGHHLQTRPMVQNVTCTTQSPLTLPYPRHHAYLTPMLQESASFCQELESGCPINEFQELISGCPINYSNSYIHCHSTTSHLPALGMDLESGCPINYSASFQLSLDHR
jgi:hypothetical protein